MAFDPKQNDEEESRYDALFNQEGAKATKPGTANSAMVAPGAFKGALGDIEHAPSAGGQSVTGWTNYDALYAANADVAKREAGKLGDRVQTSAQGAMGGVNKAWQDFDAKVKANTLQGPTDAQRSWAKYGSTGVQQPKEVTAYTQGNAQTGQQHAQTERGQGLEGPSYEQMLAQGWKLENGTWIPPTAAERPSDEELRAQIEAGAGGKYAGPSALSTLDEYGELAKKIGLASDEANALGSQGGLEALLAGQGPDTEMDAMLLGSAGRGRFAQLEKNYGGLRDWLGEGNKRSLDEVAAAKAATESAAGDYGALLDQFNTRVGADEQRAQETNERSDSVIAGAKDTAATKQKFKEYMAAARNEGASGLDNFRNQLHDVARATDLTMSGNNRGIVESATNSLSPMSSTNTGNVSDVWNEDDWDVWGSMSDADWMEFNSLPDAAKEQWIMDRKAKLRGKG